MSRRAVLHGIGGGVSLSYTGTYDYFGDAKQGYAVLKSSGTLTINGTVDICLVGGGGKGGPGGSGSGGGGAGGFVENYTAQSLNGNFSVTIGAGSTTQGAAGGATSVGATYTANGGNSATSRAGASGRGNGGAGAISFTAGYKGDDGIFPWGDSVNFASYRVSGCGGGGGTGGISAGNGGAGGGGKGGGSSSAPNGAVGAANTGGGGGGAYNKSGATGGSGGSGVVLVRWGY